MLLYMEDPFASLKAAEVAEFTPPSSATPSDSLSPETENVPDLTGSEPAGDAPPAEEPAPLEAQGEEPEEPSESAGETPAGEEPASETDDYAVALRAAGGDPNNIPKKLRETLDNYSKINNELARYKREEAARLAAPSAPSAAPGAPASPAAVAPGLAPAPPASVQPDQQAIEREVNVYLSQDAVYTQAARGHYANLVERVKIVGGTDDKGASVGGRLAEINEKIAALMLYTPEAMKKHGVELDEFALSQMNPDKITNSLYRLESEKATLEARDITLQLQNQQYEQRMLGRQSFIAQNVTSRMTSASREELDLQSQEKQAAALAQKWNESLASLSKQHGLTDEEEIINASLRAQKAARANPDEAIENPASLIEVEIKRAAARMDKFKRDGVRTAAIRKTATTAPMAPAGTASVANAPNSSSTFADPFAALKQSDKARYVGAR